MDTLNHPAVAVATDALAVNGDRDLTPIRAVDRGDTVAVLVDGERARYVVFVQHRDGHWVTPGIVNATARSDRHRSARTPDHLPLHRMSTKLFARAGADDSPEAEGWFAVTGTAAEDAVAVSVTSTLDEQTSPISEDGSAFVVARTRTSEQPRIYVHTCDGRRVLAGPLGAPE